MRKAEKMLEKAGIDPNTLKEVPTNKNGTYTKEDIIVNYVYTKNTGDIENPDTEKTGPDTINSVDGVFEYNINAPSQLGISWFLYLSLNRMVCE